MIIGVFTLLFFFVFFQPKGATLEEHKVNGLKAQAIAVLAVAFSVLYHSLPE